MDILDNICDIDPSKIDNYDILCAGFPCQPFSQAGHHKGFEDSRGIYGSLDECISICVETRGGGPQPPKDPDSPTEESATEAVIESKSVIEDGVKGKPTPEEEEEAGICTKGNYWCEKRGCIPLKEEC